MKKIALLILFFSAATTKGIPPLSPFARAFILKTGINPMLTAIEQLALLIAQEAHVTESTKFCGLAAENRATEDQHLTVTAGPNTNLSRLISSLPGVEQSYETRQFMVSADVPPRSILVVGLPTPKKCEKFSYLLPGQTPTTKAVDPNCRFCFATATIYEEA